MTHVKAGSADVLSPRARFLSQDACKDLVGRIQDLVEGGGVTTATLDTSWTGSLRWGRNRISTAGDVRNNELAIHRTIRGATGTSYTNQIDDHHLEITVRRAERLLRQHRDYGNLAASDTFTEPYSKPNIWSDTSYDLDAGSRAAQVQTLMQRVEKAGMVAAGYLQVAAHAQLTFDSDRFWYYPYTLAQFSVTVRDPQGTGSGWAGVDKNDWSRVNAEHITEVALDKCLRSRNPVAVEPGRYTTILEPQAVCDFVKILFTPGALSRVAAEDGDFRTGVSTQTRPSSVYNSGPGLSKLGQRIIDERVTIYSDPSDPETAFPPFFEKQVFHPATWIKDGVLHSLAYSRQYAVQQLSQNTGGLPATGAFHMVASSPLVSIDDMIATTKRGLLVTRFWGIPPVPLDPISMMLTGYTRDGLWLIENGKVTKAVKNFRFTESPVFALNNIEQIGKPQRVFRPQSPYPFGEGYAPVVVPALKVRDFSFTSLSEAV